MCAELATADDRAVLNDLLGGNEPYLVECSRFTPLIEGLLSSPPKGAAPQPLTRLLEPNGADEMAHLYQFGGLANGGGSSPCFS